MSFEQYLIPTNPKDWGFELGFKDLTLGKNTKMYVPGQPVPPLPEGGLVVLGVGEDRGAEANAGCSAAPNEIRRYLYRLALPALDVQLVDLGNISVGQMVEDVRLAINGEVPVEYFGRLGGIVPEPEEIVEALKTKLMK